MRRGSAFAFITVVGLFVGWFGAAVMAPPVDRVHEGIRLFETHCLPFARQEEPPSRSALHPLKLSNSQTLWLDARSGWLLETNAYQCSISDAFQSLPRQMQNGLLIRTTKMIAREFPAVQRERKANFKLFDLMEVWSQFPADESRLLTISLSRIAADGPNSETILTLSMPGRSTDTP